MKKKVRISFFDEKKLRISQDIPTQGYHRLTKIGDIPGYPDVWDIPADNSSFWDISGKPDLTRLKLTCPTGTDSSRGICTRGISIGEDGTKRGYHELSQAYIGITQTSGYPRISFFSRSLIGITHKCIRITWDNKYFLKVYEDIPF